MQDSAAKNQVKGVFWENGTEQVHLIKKGARQFVRIPKSPRDLQ